MNSPYLYIALIFLLSSCFSRDGIEKNENGEQFVAGYSLEGSLGPFCTLRFPVQSSSKKQLYKAVDDHLPQFSINTEYFVTRIVYGSVSFFEVSSRNFCADQENDRIVNRFLRKSDRAPIYVGTLNIEEKATIVDKFGEFSRGFDDLNPVVKSCSVENKTDRAVDHFDILKLRHRYAVPILFNQWSVSSSKFLFENDCKNKDRYLQDVIEITGISTLN